MSNVIASQVTNLEDAIMLAGIVIKCVGHMHSMQHSGCHVTGRTCLQWTGLTVCCASGLMMISAAMAAADLQDMLGHLLFPPPPPSSSQGAWHRQHSCNSCIVMTFRLCRQHQGICRVITAASFPGQHCIFTQFRTPAADVHSWRCAQTSYRHDQQQSSHTRQAAHRSSVL